MSIRVLAMIVAVCSSWQATAAGLCEVAIDKSNPRRFDMRFPGKVITIVGHIHPVRGHHDNSTTFESYLLNLFKDPTKVVFGDQKIKDDTKIQIAQFVGKNSTAMKHWDEDRKTLDTTLRAQTHKAFAIEQSIESVEHLNNSRAAYAINARGLRSLGYSASAIERLLGIALTPPILMRVRNPKLFGDAKVISLEPNKQQIEDYEKAHCVASNQARARREELRHQARDRLAVRLVTRGIPVESVRNSLNNIDEKIKAHMWNVAYTDARRYWRVTTAVGVALAEQVLGSELSNEDLKDLAAWLDMTDDHNEKFEILDDGLPVESRIRSFDQQFRAYEECNGRDSLIAQNLAKQTESTMMFIGGTHLVAQAALLTKECLKQLLSSAEGTPAETSQRIQ